MPVTTTRPPSSAVAAAPPRFHPWRTSQTTIGSSASAMKNAMRMLTPRLLRVPSAYQTKMPTKTVTTIMSRARGSQRGGLRGSSGASATKSRGAVAAVAEGGGEGGPAGAAGVVASLVMGRT